MFRLLRLGLEADLFRRQVSSPSTDDSRRCGPWCLSARAAVPAPPPWPLLMRSLSAAGDAPCCAPSRPPCDPA